MASRLIAAGVHRQAKHAVQDQQKTFERLIRAAVRTSFGKDHGFASITNHRQFCEQVRLQNYHSLEPYINRVRQGEQHVLWPGKPAYMAKTSGTTGDYKYIPISREAMPQHIRAARNALACYVVVSGKAGFVNGKMLFLQGSPQLDNMHGIPTGRLSGIVAHYVPAYLQTNRLPTYATNTIGDWNEKVKLIVKETLAADMRLFGGIPSWLQQYFELLLLESGKQNLGEIFPHLQVLIHGGVHFEPYRKKFETLFGKQVDVIETYPATEGFIAYQDHIHEPGMLLNTRAGIFYEFIDMEDLHKDHPPRITLEEVKLNRHYAIVLNTNSGLFGYLLGDTVSFVSRHPYRIVVTGRIKEYVSAFGEQVYAHQTDAALERALQKHGGTVSEYHVHPVMETAKPYHRWLIEFGTPPGNLAAFEAELDLGMHTQNIFYRDIVLTGVIDRLKVQPVGKNGFYQAMQRAGKLGEQYKVPRLANNSRFAKLFDQERVLGGQ